MYTQCPDCSTAFRVTANVLKQAAGKVRCGGCGHAFNALDYLSETPPDDPPEPAPDDVLPELKPEREERDGNLPESISAEHSAALLKTLDQLAGSDIRIEDTGVEWRVLEDDEVGESAVDEVLDASPTPVDQFLAETPNEVDSPEIFEAAANQPASTPVEELRFDDDTPLPEDFDFDVGPAPAAPPEPVPEPEPEPPAEDLQADLELSDPDEWQDLLVEFDDLAADPESPEPADDAAMDVDIEPLDARSEDILVDAATGEDVEDSIDELLDMDTQFALQAEAMGIDLSGSHDLDLDDDEDEDESAALNRTLDDDVEADAEHDLELANEREDPEPGEINLELDLEDDDIDSLPADDLASIEFSDDDDTVLVIDDDEDAPAHDEPVILPLTEEEQTINMMIDQDLLSMAVEDEDGFASTIVMSDEDAADMVPGKADDETDAPDEAAGFETIIMEGEFVRSAKDKEKLAADAAAAAALAREADAREAEKAAQSSQLNYGLIGVAVLLVLLLVGQILHFSRDALATSPGFNEVVGPVYRAVGKPLTPAWDISGWRFEVTRGSTDENAETLTIYSRLGNKSDEPLPYPLIGISLTDRFEEVIGSRVLDPSEYLGPDLDPRKLVAPGDTFNAVMTIRSPDPDATGFKLNVCYRVADGQLRCAIQDFR